MSYRQLEELIQQRGAAVDHATINRWVLKYSPQPETTFHHRKRPVWMRWRLDETYIKIKGRWHYFYRAVDKSGQTVDFLLTAPAGLPSGAALSHEGDPPSQRAGENHD